VPGRSAKPQRSRRRKQAQDNRRHVPAPIPAYLLTSILLTGIVFLAIAGYLHRWWIGFPWLGTIGLWGLLLVRAIW
jgi:hypothetical protein